MLLAIDVGIKHLAYCVTDLSGIIHHWSIVNLVEEQKTEPCITCGKPSKAISPSGYVCGRHIGKQAKWIHGKNSKTSPTIPQLQTFLKENGLDPKGKKDVLLDRAKTIATIWLPKQKNATTFASHTCGLHDAIRAWITRDWNVLSNVSKVYIEHQPVLKNPVMKTVQLVVFCSLRERLLASHPVECYFVHAGKKVKGMESGDAGYTDRKKGGEERVSMYLQTFSESHSQYNWFLWWRTQLKKDDLSDAYCMIMDVKM